MDKGSHFYNCDFQVHSPRDINWTGNKPTSQDDRKEYSKNFILACRNKGLNAVAITDHHDFTFFPYIREAAKSELQEDGTPVLDKDKIIVFPGLELTFTMPASCQALLIIDSEFPEDQLIRILNILSINPNPESEESTAETVPIPSDVINGLIDLYAKLDSIDILRCKYIVLPNLSRRHSGILRQGFYEHYKKMPCVSGYVDGAIPENEGFLNIINGRDRNYGFKPIAVFQTSDNRKESFEDLGKNTTWVKWAEPTAEALRQASLAKESRITNNLPEIPQIQILKISVTNSKFMGRIELSLNPQYNAFIGGRGTGKSSLLEYIRWGLCDFDKEELAIEDEKSEIFKRRQTLIKKTLEAFSGEVRVSVLVNGIPHIIKRGSINNALMIKIGASDFQVVSEEEVRRLLPIQAYSQKQLSSVGIRTDELKRFIEQPIANDLNNIKFNLREISKNIRISYSNYIRKKELQREIDELQLQQKSISEQVTTLRSNLKGISDEDKIIIEQKQLFENEQTYIQESINDFQIFKNKVNELKVSINEYPTKINKSDEIQNTELISEIEQEKMRIFSEVKSLIDSTLDKFNESNLSDFNSLIDDWNSKKESFDKQYNTIKEKATENESTIKEISKLEYRLREITDSINERQSNIKELRSPEEAFEEERKKWIDLHNQKVDLLNKQATLFTELSSEIIKAEVTKHINIGIIKSDLVEALTGTRINKDKIDNLCDSIIASDNPLVMWSVILEELRVLAEIQLSEDSKSEIPETPVITKLGFNEGNITNIVSRLNPDIWLNMVTKEIDFDPEFSYSTNNDMGDVIPFSEASAGQQATALLSVLLNIEGTPLIIDQPEDDIDNKAINDIIQNIWKSKSKRQLIFTSHNANLVVNGDAELVVCCDYKESSQQTQGEIKFEGSIDNYNIRNEITTVMEGGERAFCLRKDKYGF
jgi:chromosome segregation protein